MNEPKKSDVCFPELSPDRVELAVERWCRMVGKRTSLDDVNRGLVVDFRKGLGDDDGYQFAR